MVVMVAFSSLERILGECSASHCPSAFKKKKKITWRLAHAH